MAVLAVAVAVTAAVLAAVTDAHPDAAVTSFFWQVFCCCQKLQYLETGQIYIWLLLNILPSIATAGVTFF